MIKIKDKVTHNYTFEVRTRENSHRTLQSFGFDIWSRWSVSISLSRVWTPLENIRVRSCNHLLSECLCRYFWCWTQEFLIRHKRTITDHMQSQVKPFLFNHAHFWRLFLSKHIKPTESRSRTAVLLLRHKAHELSHDPRHQRGGDQSTWFKYVAFQWTARTCHRGWGK